MVSSIHESIINPIVHKTVQVFLKELIHNNSSFFMMKIRFNLTEKSSLKLQYTQKYPQYMFKLPIYLLDTIGISLKKRTFISNYLQRTAKSQPTHLPRMNPMLKTRLLNTLAYFTNNCSYSPPFSDCHSYGENNAKNNIEAAMYPTKRDRNHFSRWI